MLRATSRPCRSSRAPPRGARLIRHGQEVILATPSDRSRTRAQHSRRALALQPTVKDAVGAATRKMHSAPTPWRSRALLGAAEQGGGRQRCRDACRAPPQLPNHCCAPRLHDLLRSVTDVHCKPCKRETRTSEALSHRRMSGGLGKEQGAGRRALAGTRSSARACVKVDAGVYRSGAAEQ